MHSFFIYDEGLGKDNVDSYFQISPRNFKVYGPKLQEKYVFGLLGIRSCLDIHQSYIYTISDAIAHHFIKTDRVDTSSETPAETHKVIHMASSGLYVYDTKKLFSGWIEKYRLAKAIGGICTHLENSLFSDRLSFVQDYHNIVVLPFPHLNLVNMVGMGQKHEYLMWR